MALFHSIFPSLFLLIFVGESFIENKTQELGVSCGILSRGGRKNLGL
jgi:hypothetical protein